MRIALVHRTLSELGGTERYTLGLSRGLAARGHEVHLFVARRDPRVTLPPGVTLHLVPWLRPTAFLKALSFDWGVRRRLKAMGPFDVTLSMARTTCQDVWRAGGGHHPRHLALSRSGFWQRFGPSAWILSALERRSVATSPHIVAVSRSSAAELSEVYQLPPSRQHVWPNPVDLDVFAPDPSAGPRVRGALCIPPEGLLVLLVGTGFERKGLSTLLAAAQKVPGIYVVAVGADRNQARYQREARQRGVHLILTGPRRDVVELYQAADIFCLPTRYDPCANATLEAAACGLPVVTTSRNGAAERLRGAALVLEDPLGVEALARALNLLRDPEIRGEVARLCREKAGSCTWQGHLDQVESLFYQIHAAKAVQVGK